MIIDAHQHFWRLDRGDYGWLTPKLARLYRDFGPNDLAPLLATAGIDQTILVQAAPTIAETEYMLSLADAHGFIRGVVGWVDFDSPAAPEALSRLAQHPKLVGVRPMIQDIADANWMLKPSLAPAFDAVIAEGLAFDALVFPRHLQPLLRLAERRPELRIVIDHGAKPAIAERSFQPWADEIATIARESSAYCKLSGLALEAGRRWTVDALRRYVDHLIACFGPERLIWGSDWPVCTLAASYGDWLAASKELLAHLSEDERTAVFGGAAQTFYRL